jgi:hypothetical protein
VSRSQPLRRCAAFAAVALLTVACGAERTVAGTGAPAPSQSSAAAPPAGPHPVAGRLLYFSADLRTPHLVHTVVRNEADRARLPGWFAGASVNEHAAREIANRIQGTDLTANAIVVYAATIGCRPAGSAELVADGAKLTLRLLDRPKPPPECFVPYGAVAVFEVPRGQLPDKPVFGDLREDPDPSGPGELLAFMPIDGVPERPVPSRADVTQEESRDRYLATLPQRSAQMLRATLDDKPRNAGTARVFAFTLSGCQATGAYLTVSQEGLAATPTGGESARCVRAEQYTAVFALPEPLVPRHPLPGT